MTKDGLTPSLEYFMPYATQPWACGRCQDGFLPGVERVERRLVDGAWSAPKITFLYEDPAKYPWEERTEERLVNYYRAVRRCACLREASRKAVLKQAREAKAKQQGAAAMLLSGDERD